MWTYSKSPTYRPSSWELLKMQANIPSMSGVSELQLVLCLLLLTILQLYHLPPPLPPPVSDSLAPVCQLLYRTTVLFKVLECKILNVLYFVCFFMYYLYEEYCKHITYYSIILYSRLS